MKIRITKKGLPKAQWMISQPGKELSLPASAAPNYTWATSGNQQVPVMPNQQTLYKINNEGTPVAKPAPVIPIKKYNKNTWINKDQSKLAYGVNEGLNNAAKFLQTNPVAKGALAFGQAASDVKDFMLPIVDIFDKQKQSNDIERAFREDLLATGPIDYTRNRGDYEMNTGMVDPYNTGAKSKGQFTNLQYLPMAQDGLSLGPISFTDEPVQRNIFQYASNFSAPATETRIEAPPSRNIVNTEATSSSSFREGIAARESGGNYKALPKDKTGKLVSSAAGKYQFLWNTHKPWIAKVTGVASKEEFLNNPQAQETAFNYWDETVLTPNAVKIKQELGVSDSIDQIKAKIHFAGTKGAFDYYSTGKETRDAFGTTTSTYALGGENIQPMKIRITGGPQKMEYGGQSNYGLDLGRKNVYTDMQDSPFENPNRMLGPVPEEYATIEAEKDETILTDVDGDGMREHMVIGGKKHENGGTPLDAKPGDFVFSDHKPKMAIKNERILSLFGKKFKKGGYTPAEIAKQYDINKYKAVLQDKNADYISKSTAERMIGNYEKKLGMLSLVQEARKGFPQGIPDVAKNVMPQEAFGGYIPEMGYGGYLEQYQVKGEVKPRTIKTKEEFDKLLASKPYKPVKGLDNVYEYYNKVVKPGTKDQTIIHKGTPGKKYIPNENEWWKSLTPQQQAAYNVKKRQQIKTDPQYIGTPDRTEIIKGIPEEVIEERDLITYMPTGDIPDKPGNPPGNPPSNPPGVPPYDPPTGGTPYGWTNPDVRNLGTALLNRTYIKKYPSVRRDLNPVTSDFRNMDWRGRAAELQGTYNSQMNTLGNFQSPTSLAANLSFMAGQQGENLINRAIDPIEQSNVQIYNQVAGRNADLVNQAMAASAQNQFLRSQDRAILNQKYNQEMIDSNNAITQAFNTGDINAAGIYNTNITESPYYYIDPRTQKMQFNSANARAAFEAARRSAGPSNDDMVSQYLAIRNKLTGVPDDEKDDVARELMGLNKSGRSSATTYPFNPKMNRYSVQQPYLPDYNTNAYPQNR